MRAIRLWLTVLVCAIACGEEEETKVQKLNRLAKEKSLYLRQHGTNPVDWYPWGAEAFEKAKKEGKPIFLSIGYASCHWCHVMEHESFADDEVAAVLNEHFVCIKVDREERPDVDEVYMNAAQAMRGGGGWPLSVWMTPEGKPFAAGTYFPKNAARGMPGFLQILDGVKTAWNDPEKRKQIEDTGRRVADFVQEVMYDGEDPDKIDPETLKNARSFAEMGFDRTYGGFSRPPQYAPKFPGPSTLEMMLRWSLRHEDDKDARTMVTLTLDAMAKGGIHDHIGGGFHRYSTTRDWLVPHFEKMLYDNAQLLGLYAWGYVFTGDERYAATARDIARWVRREMTGEGGAFFSAQDADDPGGPEGEGGFYTWTPDEVKKVLGDTAEAKAVIAWFGIKKDGNWHEKPGRSLLETQRTVEEVGKELALEPKKLRAMLQDAIARMYDAREKRPKPLTDKKVLSGWNALMISGFAKAHQALGDESFLESALACARFLRKHLMKEGRLLRRYEDGEAAHDAVLADYAYVVAAFLDLYESTFDPEWLTEAMRLNALTVELFYDPKKGGFYFTAKDGEKLLARGKPGFDQARPSGNGVMSMNLLRIAELTGEAEPRAQAQKTLEFFSARVGQSSVGHAAILNALDFSQKGTREIFIAGKLDDERTRALIDAVRKDPDPNRVVAVVTPGIEKILPPAAGKTLVDGKPAAYVCRNYACDAPVTDPHELTQRRKGAKKEDKKKGG